MLHRNERSRGVSDIWAALDGRANAPAGTPQYPTFFTALFGINYAGSGGKRPPWMVAGVDYLVGPRPNVTLQPWTTICPNGGSSGVFSDDGDNIIATGGSNLTISGIDFTNPSNRSLFVNGATGNNLLTDCNFVSTVTHVTGARLTCNNPTVEYCKFTGSGNVNAVGSSGDLKFDACTGLSTALYNWFKDACEQNVAFQPAVSAGLVCKFNLFDEAGLGSSQAFGPHGDWIFSEAPNDTVTISPFTISFNTGKQTTAAATANTQGFAAEFNGGGTQANIPLYSNVSFNNNSCVCGSSAAVNQFFLFSTSQTPAPAIVLSQNYVDLRFLGSTPQWYSNNVNVPLIGDQLGTTSISGNIRMDTGAAIS